MERKIRFAPDSYYHIYNRGVEKREIFLDDADYKRFLELLYLCNGTKSIVVRDILSSHRYTQNVGEKIVAIGAYALMPNHFHLLARANESENGITEFLRKVSTGYTMYFNKKYKRVGPLFQGVFKAEIADTDEYLKYLFSYIHLNPAKLIKKDWRNGLQGSESKKIFHFVKNYPYSSYQDYDNGTRLQSSILTVDAFPNYFESKGDLEISLLDWIDFDPTP